MTKTEKIKALRAELAKLEKPKRAKNPAPKRPRMTRRPSEVGISDVDQEYFTATRMIRNAQRAGMSKRVAASVAVKKLMADGYSEAHARKVARHVADAEYGHIPLSYKDISMRADSDATRSKNPARRKTVYVLTWRAKNGATETMHTFAPRTAKEFAQMLADTLGVPVQVESKTI